MPVTCDPKSLAEAAKCYCFNEREANAIIIYLLKQIAGNTSTPSELAALAKCYCTDAKTSKAIITYLLCQLNA